MSYSLYFIIRQVVMSLLVFFGLHMIFVSLPKSLRNSTYQRSLRIMGFAFLAVPISCFLYTMKSRLDFDVYYAPAINLTAYFATFVLMSLSFLTLLGRRFSRVVMSAFIAAILIYPLPLCLSLIFGSEELASYVLTASYSLFVAVIILMMFFILHTYWGVVRGMEDFYSDDVAICVSWISKSIVLLVVLSIVCVIAPLFFTLPPWMRQLFMFYGVGCYLHIFYGYWRMLVKITDRVIDVGIAESVIANSSGDFDGVMSPEVVSSIQRSLDLWISEKQYMQKSVTIADLSKAIKSNRTYLSKYINITYRCTFKSWISQLRLDEAKRLILADPSATMSSISDMVGFASVESFTHIFTRVEGASPSQWREERSENN